jgi:perosamine synthetase
VIADGGDFIPLAEPWLPRECAEAVRRQVESTFVGPGPAAGDFAKRIADLCGVHAAVPVASGTLALSVAARVLGLQPGDEVIVPAYGVISVINAFASIGMTPRLAEIDRSTGCIDPELLSEAMTSRTKATVYVDFCGSIGGDLTQVAERCAAQNVPLIEDAAWAFGRTSTGRLGGSSGAIGTTSFSVPKIVTTGQGGAVLVHSEEHRRAALAAVDQGDWEWRRTTLNRGIGSNLRLSDLAASLGIAATDHMAERLARKGKIFDLLSSALGERLFRAADGEPATQHIIFVERPDDMVRRLASQNIAAARPYRPIYHHPPFVSLRDRDFPASEFWFSHAVYLPSGLALREEDADRIVRAVERSNGRFVDWRG